MERFPQMTIPASKLHVVFFVPSLVKPASRSTFRRNHVVCVCQSVFKLSFQSGFVQFPRRNFTRIQSDGNNTTCLVSVVVHFVEVINVAGPKHGSTHIAFLLLHHLVKRLLRVWCVGSWFFPQVKLVLGRTRCTDSTCSHTRCHARLHT